MVFMFVLTKAAAIKGVLRLIHPEFRSLIEQPDRICFALAMIFLIFFMCERRVKVFVSFNIVNLFIVVIHNGYSDTKTLQV